VADRGHGTVQLLDYKLWAVPDNGRFSFDTHAALWHLGVWGPYCVVQFWLALKLSCPGHVCRLW